MPDARSTEVLVIGAGPGGYVAAIRAAQLGRKVLVVERERLGGVCLNVGCIPSKAIIHAAKTVKHARHAGEMGVNIGGDVTVDLKQTQSWKEGVVGNLTGGIAQLFKANGVEKLDGFARFTGPNEARVEQPDGNAVTVTFEKCIVATGSRPVQVPGFEFDGEGILDSTAALGLTELPEKLVVIGGGFIGLEIGNAYATMGSEVTVVEMMDQILPGTDKDIVRVVSRSLKKNGVEQRTGAKAKGWTKDGARLKVTIETGKGEETLEADKVLVSVGRRPNTDSVDLAAAGVEVNDRGLVPINAYAQTNVPHIYAIGDITPGPMLAHRASKEGLVAAAHISGDDATTLDYRALPWAAFTDPEVAVVGLTEDEAREKGYEPVVGRFPFGASGRAQSTNETEGFVKVVSDKGTDLVLGVHIVGPEASNLIAEAALGIELGAYTEDLALTIHTHPTLPEALMEAAEAVHKVSIHGPNR